MKKVTKEIGKRTVTKAEANHTLKTIKHGIKVGKISKHDQAAMLLAMTGGKMPTPKMLITQATTRVKMRAQVPTPETVHAELLSMMSVLGISEAL